MNLIGRLANWRSNAFLANFIQGTLHETTYGVLWIDNIYAHIHRPKIPGKYPGLIFVPGGKSPGTDYDKGNGVRAQDAASLGFVVLHYDPSGRGKTGGKEEYWGTVHQDELSQIINFFSETEFTDNDNIGIMSFSIGIIIATGALARFPTTKIKYLFDWEGPSSKFSITKNDTYEPLKDFPTSNEDFWNEREATKYISRVECAYFRYQAEVDHMQGTFKGHAVELLNLATRGKALWTRCNDNPPNIIFDENKLQEYRWVPSHLNHKGQILKYLLDIQKKI